MYYHWCLNRDITPERAILVHLTLGCREDFNDFNDAIVFPWFVNYLRLFKEILLHSETMGWRNFWAKILELHTDPLRGKRRAEQRKELGEGKKGKSEEGRKRRSESFRCARTFDPPSYKNVLIGFQSRNFLPHQKFSVVPPTYWNVPHPNNLLPAER